MAQALTDYQKGKMIVEEIAAKHGISTATITVWAKKAGLPLRKRGRRRQEMPTERQLNIINLASVYRYDQVGAKLGLHRQSVHRIVKRWRNWASPSKAPFAPGDMLIWCGKELTVVDANWQDGTLIDDRGKIFMHFPWYGGQIPEKIGINPKYVVPSPAAA